ncbi:MAG: glutamate--cysteine ligase [Rickettsiales bacterium]|nr:glutamate--cysteine ligase [Rickettsiales bacterium]
MLNVKKNIFEIISKNSQEIENWFVEKYQEKSPPFYSSVDIRYSGFKIAPVDTNLFPAGFNLLTEKQKNNASFQAKNYFEKYFSNAKTILLIAENHTRNKFYLENVFSIKNILEQAGMEVFTSKFEFLEDEKELETASGNKIFYHKIQRENNQIFILLENNQKIIPDVILVNNDMSSGAPEILVNLIQPVFPPIGLGWYQRKKTKHFASYNLVARQFAEKFNFDPWLISSAFTKCEKINFREKEGLECVAYNASELLKKIQIKYDEYNIPEKPYLFVKANSGTYGMGIMVLKEPSDILEINKKERHSLDKIKEGVENTEVIIQEGIPTIDTYDGKTAEPLVYLVNGNAVGCSYRINSNQDKFGNLNSKGMEFHSFDRDCSSDVNKNPLEKEASMDCPVQALIARLASCASTSEV